MTRDREPHDRPSDPVLATANMSELAGAPGSGAIWSLPHGGDLDANVVRVEAGGAIDEHVNDEVDVLITVWSGSGDVTVGAESVGLEPGVVVGIARGQPRAIYAGPNDLVYLSVHRRRGPMGIRSSRVSSGAAD